MKRRIVLPIASECDVASATAQEALTPRDSFGSASESVEVAANPAVLAAPYAGPSAIPAATVEGPEILIPGAVGIVQGPDASVGTPVSADGASITHEFRIAHC
jgi:hypothetical protein